MSIESTRALQKISVTLEKLLARYEIAQQREDVKWKITQEELARERAFREKLVAQQDEQLKQQQEAVANGSKIANAIEDANKPEPWQRDPDEESNG